MRPVRWFLCKGFAWRVVRRPNDDKAWQRAYAVYRGGNIKPRLVWLDPDERPLADSMKAAVRIAVKAEGE